jgi:hypothetical protein
LVDTFVDFHDTVDGKFRHLRGHVASQGTSRTRLGLHQDGD